MERKYTAFISYRHKPLDIQVAQKLHTMIERYRIPKALRKNGNKHLGLVFRDRDELPLSSNLTEDIYEALDHSEFLIVVCTPDTPKSLWCQREIQYFIDHHGRNRILTVLAAGTPEESIPDIITTVYANDGKTVLDRVEPLCAFLVDDSDRKVLKNLNEEFLRLAAAILNCPYDALKQRQKRYRARRRAAILAGAAAVLLTIFSLLIQWNLDVSQKNQEISSLNDQILIQLRQSQLNESQALALLSENQLQSGLREDAVQSALDALEGDRPYYAPAEAALTDAVHAYDGDKYYYAAKLQMDTHVEQVILSRDGRYAVATDANKNGTCIDLTTGRILWENLPVSMNWQSSQITGDGKKLLALDDQAIREYDIATGDVLRTLSHAGAQIQTLSRDAATLVIGYKPKQFAPQMTLEVIDVESGQTRSTFCRDIPYRDIVFSYDSRYCLLVPKEEGDQPAIIDCENGRIYDVELSGSMVAACPVPDACFAFLSRDGEDTYAYEIVSPEGILLRSLPAGSGFASQVRYILADKQWIYAVRQDGGIQIVHQRGGVMFDDSYVDEKVLLAEGDLLGEYKPLLFFDSRGGLVAVNEEDTIHRLYFTRETWMGTSLGPLHYYEVPGVVSEQLCRTDVYGETLEYQKAFMNPNGSEALCLADKEDDSLLIFLRYVPKAAEDISDTVPGGCTEENTRAYLQEAYLPEKRSEDCIGDKNPWLATVSDTGHVLQVTDLESGAEIAALDLHSGDISDMVFVCDDRYLLAVEMLEQAVILVDTSNWQLVGKYKTTLTQYSYAGDSAFAALNEDGTRLYIGNLLALQQGMVIDTQSWTLLARVPYMACYDRETDRILCMDPAAGKLIAYPALSTEMLMQQAEQHLIR